MDRDEAREMYNQMREVIIERNNLQEECDRLKKELLNQVVRYSEVVDQRDEALAEVERLRNEIMFGEE